MRQELINLVSLLSTREYHTANELSERLEISPKTVRTRLRELADEGRRYGISVKSRARYGYILIENEENAIGNLVQEPKECFPNSTESRTDYLLVYLLNHAEYTKIENLCEFLCVSRSTLQTSIRETERILNQYHLCLHRKPNYGICVQGDEFDIRRCIGECFVKRKMLDIGMEFYSIEEKRTLAGLIFEITEHYKISLSADAYENLITQLYVAMKRIKKGHVWEFFKEYDKEKYQAEWKCAFALSEKIGSWQKISYTESEIHYILIYLAGSRVVGGADDNRTNFVIREELDRLVVQMLDLIYEEYGIEMRDDFNLRMALNQHMVPFDIRMKYRIKIVNPIIDEIKQNYVFGYTLARRSITVLETYYENEIPEDEIGYFAILFVYAMEQKYKDKHKTRILIVCGAGRASSKFLKYKYEQEFGDYLEKIYVCSIYELEKFDFDKIEYVFTTVPISIRVPKPITEVGQFLGGTDITKVRSILCKGQVDFLDNYYKKDQFFTQVEGDTKEEVLRNICHKIGTQRNLPERFYESILKREELGPTAFGNYVAMPHPYKIITEETFVYVSVLKKEVMWDENPVRLVFLSVVGPKEDKTLSRFYEVTTTLFLQEERINRIIKEENFEILMQMLRQIYYEE